MGDMSVRNVFIVVFSEFADFDKIVEAWFLIESLNDDLDIIDAKVKAVASKTVFWTIGYLLIMPPSLAWAYLYAQKHKDELNIEEETDTKKKQEEIDVEQQNNEEKNNEETKTTTPMKYNE